MKRGTKRWLAAGGVLLVLVLVAVAFAPDSGVAGFLEVLFVLWIVATALWVIWRLWRWMTWRVGVRLFVSYVLIGLTPIVSLLAVASIGLYMLAGQYTSVRYGDSLVGTLGRLQTICGEVAAVASERGAGDALERLRELEARRPHELVPIVKWSVHDGSITYRTSDPEGVLAVPLWVDGAETGIVRHRGGFAALTATRHGNAVVSALIPLDRTTSYAVSEAMWYDVAFAIGDETEGEPGEVEVDAYADLSGIQLRVNGGDEEVSQLWPAWTSDDGRLFDKPWVLWFRVATGVRDLETGELVPDGALVSLLRTSVDRAWDDFVLSRYDLSSGLKAVLFGFATFFGLLNAIALLVATAMIWSITRSTSRLSRGARSVAEGDLDHRIRVRRRDQLGELAERFNHMTASVQGMLTDVAEKERLAQELELAREIQESLLPASGVSHGLVSVASVFRPAAEVGGDYFDVFPLDGDRLVVTVGDVAGHGLSTGLLMASLKSAVAALVHEGYGGTELIGRLNRVLVGQRPGRTLVTFGILELDPAEGSMRYASAGHTPPFVLRPDGSVVELAVGSLPLGSELMAPVSVEERFEAGSRLVLYSDGLPEAIATDGEPVGYERLEAMLRGHGQAAPDELAASVLRSWEKLVGGAAPADDVTLVVIEAGSAG